MATVIEMNLPTAIGHYAKAYGIPVPLATALCKVESNMQEMATRFEYAYRWMWDCRNKAPFRRVSSEEALETTAPADFKAPNWDGVYISDDTEWTHQKTSWGPFQMMGALLRERGFVGYMPEICSNPRIAAAYAMVHLSYLHRRYHKKHGWSGVIAAYNAGSPRKDEDGHFVNQAYVQKVADAGGKKWLPLP